MDTLRLLLWLSMAATVLPVYCAADPRKGKENGKPKRDVGCTYNGFSAWIPFQGGTMCYRYRTSTNGCANDYEVKAAPCDSVTVAPTCSWTYTAWGIYSLDPCRQRRYGTNPCYATVTQYRDCFEACPPESPSASSDALVLEQRSASRRKRDVPWCPEETWNIYGRSDGCMAVQNATWYKCIHEVCQDCIPPAGSGLICIPNKFTTLRIPLICPGGWSDVMTVTRPMDCTCFQVRTTCDKFEGPCG